MTGNDAEEERLFRDAVQGLRRGDFSRLEPLFDERPGHDRPMCRIIEWHASGCFDAEPEALAEAFTCACFLGRARVADYLLAQHVDALAGAGTGLNGFHWAANRGQLDTVKLLIERGLPLELKNMYGGTVLGAAVWAAIHESKPDHLAVIEALIGAGARLDAVDYPSGNERVDALLRRHGAT
jgi:hypothetical protein